MTSDQNWYQDPAPQSHAAILYGEVTDGAPPRHVLTRFGQEAYEMLQLHIYMRELLRVKEEAGYVCWSHGFGMLWAAMEVLGQSARFPRLNTPGLVLEEMGSTLFATIDKLKKLRALYGGVIDPDSIRYVGVEPSHLFARTAELLHGDVNIRHVSDWKTLAPESGAHTLGRSYQATSYAFRNVYDLCSWIFRSTASVHGIWFSHSGDQVIQVHGKRTTFFSLERFCALARSNGFSVLPIASRQHTFGEHEFLSAFVLVHRFDRRQNLYFQELCQRHANFGVEGFASTEAENVVDAIRMRTIVSGAHAGFSEPTGRASSTFDFESAAVRRQFEDYLSRLSSIDSCQ